MLTILGRDRETFCDGLSRRSFLRIGALSLGGAALPQLLEANGSGAGGLGHKAVIMIFLPGGPPHQDMWDLKRDAPREIRGEFSPIKTNVPGVEVGELFPRLATMADKYTIVRSMVGSDGGHDAQQCLTGRTEQGAPPGGWPSMGAVLAKLEGAADPAVPPFVGLSPDCKHRQWGDPGQPGFLGPACSAFQPNGGGGGDMVLNGITLDRLRDRRRLLESLDRFRRDTDASGTMEGMDTFTQQAFGVLTSSRLAEALDFEREDPKVVEMYGRGSSDLVADGCWRLTEQFLMARRLVESGVRCVTLGFSRWDWHGNNFNRAREDMPMLDRALSALLTDLHQRGLDKEVSVVVWGEFGRTPKINNDAGRDHWPNVSCALLAGGGMNHGQVIGATDRLGGEAVERPVHFQEVFATLYTSLGIDVRTATVTDLTGRPRFLVDAEYAPMPELV